jgi:hypothetical protein
MFKVGDKVKCIDRGDNVWLTQGKEYKVVGIPDCHPLPDMINIKADDGLFHSYYATRFEVTQDTPTARSNDPATSKGKRKVNKYEQSVIIMMSGGYYEPREQGWTGKELAAQSGHQLNCITPRFAPLRRKGLIKDSGTKRDKQIVWVLA